MNTFYKILYSNDEIIKQRNTKWYYAVIIFIVSVILIATPFVSARLLQTPESLLQQFDGVESGIIRVLSEFDCRITDYQLQCEQPFTSFSDNGYTFYVNVKENQKIELVSQSVLLSEKTVTVYTPEGYIQGDYSLLEGASFDDLLQIKTDENLNDSELVAHLLQNINQSTLSQHIPQTYVSVFIQYSIYVVLVSVVNLAINANRLKEKVTLKNFLVMNTLAMFSLALLSAVVGLFSPVNATALFPLLYMARVILIYFKLLRIKSLVN